MFQIVSILATDSFRTNLQNIFFLSNIFYVPVGHLYGFFGEMFNIANC